MRKILFGILIFCLLFPGLPGFAAPDEGYGEDHGALGQFVDTFDTSGNVSTNVNVIRNTTLEVMELNYTGVSPPTYNISDFVETDPANRYSQTDEVSTWAGIRRGDASSRLVGDLGANYFQDSFTLYFEVNITDAEAGDASWRTYCMILALMNHASDYDDNRRIHIWANQRQADPANDAVYEIYFVLRSTAGTQDVDTSLVMSVGTVYFMNLTRHNSGDDVRLTIKTGSHTGAIHDTLDVTVGVFGGEVLRYVFTPAMKLNVNDPNDWISGTVSRIMESLGVSGYVSPGYFTTTNYLNDTLANGTTLALQTISTIPVNTIIKVQFSNDSSVWRNNLGVIGLGNVLTTGLFSIDMRGLNWTIAYLRFNESTASNLITPMLNQSKIITTIGNATVGGAAPGGAVARPTILIVGGLITIVVAVFIGVKKR